MKPWLPLRWAEPHHAAGLGRRARVVGERLVLRQEVFLCWDEQPAGIGGDYCFVFQRAE